MTDEKKKIFWTNKYATSTSVSSSASSGVFIMTSVNPGRVQPLSDEEFKKLVAESDEAKNAFEKAKEEFQKNHGIVWDPQTEYQSEIVAAESAAIMSLRDKATSLLAKVLAAPRK